MLSLKKPIKLIREEIFLFWGRNFEEVSRIPAGLEGRGDKRQKNRNKKNFNPSNNSRGTISAVCLCVRECMSLYLSIL